MKIHLRPDQEIKKDEKHVIGRDAVATIISMKIHDFYDENTGFSRERLLHDEAIKEDDCIVFRARGFHRYLINNGITITNQALAHTLRYIGGESKRLGVYVRKTDSTPPKPTTTRAWVMPCKTLGDTNA